MDFQATLNKYIDRVGIGIGKFVPNEYTQPILLHESMNYSLKAGGKRLRPVILLAAHALTQNKDFNPLPAAVALECLHTYTLIHDDLPCMDDSSFRRGKQSNHKQYDEATALLAGDSLLTLAFEIIGENYEKIPVIGIKLVKELANAAGSRKLIGGQMEDFHNRGTWANSADRLRYIQENKTGALFSAAFAMGMILGQAKDDQISKVRLLGLTFGKAFQIIDDILDLVGEKKDIGKETGLDKKNETLTYPSIYGLEKSYDKAADYVDECMNLLSLLEGDTAFFDCILREIYHKMEATRPEKV